MRQYNESKIEYLLTKSLNLRDYNFQQLCVHQTYMTAAFLFNLTIRSSKLLVGSNVKLAVGFMAKRTFWTDWSKTVLSRRLGCRHTRQPLSRCPDVPSRLANRERVLLSSALKNVR